MELKQKQTNLKKDKIALVKYLEAMRRADKGQLLKEEELQKAELLLRMYSLDHERPKNRKDH